MYPFLFQFNTDTKPSYMHTNYAISEKVKPSTNMLSHDLETRYSNHP